jgi:hypothetical protein
VIERWLDENIRGTARHAIGYTCEERGRIAKSEYAFAERIAFGFNIDEKNRVERSCEYNTFTREAFYPLLEWGWSREDCLDYLESLFGIRWKKSACVYCPFLALTGAAVDRHLEHPQQVADALLMEHVSLAFNPRSALYKSKSLFNITRASENVQALELYEKSLRSATWALYRVRRIYSAKGKADRSLEQWAQFGDRDAAFDALRRLAGKLGCDVEEAGPRAYAWRERRSETEYPTREELFSIAPATVPSKTHYGLEWFESRWTGMQMKLFQALSRRLKAGQLPASF